jgi:hypothetical protein
MERSGRAIEILQDYLAHTPIAGALGLDAPTRTDSA